MTPEERAARIAQLERERDALLGSQSGQPIAPAATARAKMGRPEAFGRGAADGFSFGFADEIAGGARDLFDTAQNAYAQRRYDPRASMAPTQGAAVRDDMRAGLQKAEQDRPLTTFGGQVAGGLAQSALPGVGPVSKGLQSAEAGVRAATVLGTGGIAGGLAAAGAANMDGLADLPRALPSIVGGTVLGAGGGAAAYKVGKGLAALGQGVKYALAGPAAKAPDVRAARILSQRLADDGVTIDALQKTRSALNSKTSGADSGARIRETLGEVANYAGSGAKRARLVVRGEAAPNTRRLAEALATVPGQAQATAAKVFQARRDTLGDDIERAAQRATTGAETNFGDELATIQETAQRESAELYNAARAVPIAPDVYAREIAPVLADVSRLGVLGKAQRQAELAAAAFRPDDPMRQAAAVSVQELAAIADGQPLQTVTVNTIDIIKKELGEQAQGAFVNGRNAQGAALSTADRRLVEAADKATDGAYGKAVSRFSGGKRAEEFLQLGRRLFKLDDFALSAMLKGSGPRGVMSADEVDVFTLGVQRALRDAIDEGDTKMVRKFITKPKAQRQLAIAMQVPEAELDDALRGVIRGKSKTSPGSSDQAKRFVAFRNTIARGLQEIDYQNRVTGGAATAGRQQAVQMATRDAEDPVADVLGAIVGDQNQGVPTSQAHFFDRVFVQPVTRTLQGAYNRARNPGIYDPKVNAALGDLVFAQPRKSDIDRLAELIAQGKAAMPDRLTPEQRRRLAMAVAATGGQTAGRLPAETSR
jgi:hypothetical protein